MLDISPDKIVVFLVIAFVVLGPGRLGEAARALGRARAQLRKFSSELPPDTANLIRNPRGALLDALAEPHKSHQGTEDAAGATRQSTILTTEQERGEDVR
jgi:Sec-independent protein translocase protein TatA